MRPRAPCLRCVLEEPPPPGSGPTCDTAGIIAPIARVAALQAAEALKLLAGRPGAAARDRHRRPLARPFDVLDLCGQAPACPACTEGRFDYARELGRRRGGPVRPRRGSAPAPAGTRLDLAGLGRGSCRWARSRATRTCCASPAGGRAGGLRGRPRHREGRRRRGPCAALYARYVGT